MLRLLRFVLGGITLIETSARRSARSLLWKERRGEQAPGSFRQPERVLAKPRNKLVVALLRRVAWLRRQKAGELIVGNNNLGEIHFTWTAENKVVTQRLW